MTTFSASATVNVIPATAVLLSINVVDPNGLSTLDLVVGGQVQLQALGNFDDGSQLDITTSVLWNSTARAVAPVNATGLVTGIAVGRANITASVTT